MVSLGQNFNISSVSKSNFLAKQNIVLNEKEDFFLFLVKLISFVCYFYIRITFSHSICTESI